MAVDTENKRRSVIQVLPVADGTVVQADRQQVGWLYAGIAVGEPVVGYLTVVAIRAYNHIETALDSIHHILPGLSGTGVSTSLKKLGHIKTKIGAKE